MKVIRNSSETIEHSLPIILTGFMGAGKSTIGKLLAEKLKRPFLDTDRILEEQTGMTVGQYIRRFGEEAFRRQENRSLSLALGEESVVIATGGGAVLNKLNRKRMLQKGWVCWLKAPAAVILRRVDSVEGRPLLEGKNDLQRVAKILADRNPYYEECHCQIDTTFKKPEQVLEEILQHYEE